MNNHNIASILSDDLSKNFLKPLFFLPVFILFLVFGVHHAEARLNPEEDFRFYHLTTADGLSHPSVAAICQDETGFMWFGTQNGLNRYDGYEMTVYRYNSDDPHSLNSNNITAIYEDSENNLWIGTGGGGLHLYDRNHDRFTRIVGDPEDWKTLSDNTIWSILEDSRGDLWIGTSYGLNVMNRSDTTMVRYFHEDEDPAGLSHNDIQVIFEDSRNNFWIGTSDGLNLMDRDEETFTRFFHEPGNPNSISSSQINTINEDDNGTLWIGTDGGGLNYYDYENEQFVSFTHDANDPTSISDNHIYSVLEDRDGLLWIGTGTEGVAVFDRVSKKFYSHGYDPDYSFSINEGGVNTLFESRDGILWAGTFAGGINYFDQNRLFFSHYLREEGTAPALSHNLIREFEQDSSGKIWIATDGGGLNRFNPQTEQFEVFRHDPENRQSIPSDIILALHWNKDGLWLGSYANGLSLLDTETWTFRHFRHDPDEPGSLSGNDVFAIHEDHEGHLWIGTNGRGLNRLKPGSDSFIRYRADPDDPESIGNDDIRAIYEDSRENLWIGSYLGHLTLFDRDQDRFIHYDINYNEEYYNSVIQDFLEDSKDRFWLASRGAGLKQFDRDNHEVVASYTVEDGLPGNNVHGIREDDNGILWLSTNGGISRFDPENGKFQNFDEKLGIQRGDFFGGSRFRDREGYIYFGGYNGFNRFHPDDIQPQSDSHDVVFTDFLIFNRSVGIGEDSPLEQHISQTDRLVIPPDASMITFRFSALNFGVVKGDRFAYMLEGLDRDWNHVGSQRTATFTNLRPGEYVLKVMATNSDGSWPEEAAELAVVVTPPFWRTAWFITCFILFIAIALFLGYRYRVHSIKTKNKQLARMVTERTAKLRESNATKDKLMSIVAHDLNNTAFGIIGFAELLKESIEQKDLKEAKEFSNHLHQMTKRFHDLLENLLTWARSQSGRIEHHPEKIRLSEIVEEHILQEKSRAHNKSIKLSSSIDPESELVVYADRNMLSTALRNLINNALKFTEKGGMVNITAAPAGKDVEISVSDTGQGMDQQQIDQILYSDELVSTTGTGDEKGTGLGLPLTRDFIKRNDGTFRVESEKGKGSTFIFTLPRVSTNGLPGSRKDQRLQHQ